MGKRVIASDFLNFPVVLAHATVANDNHRLDRSTVTKLLAPRNNIAHFIEETFTGIFYTPKDLRFLDMVSFNIEDLQHPTREPWPVRR